MGWGRLLVYGGEVVSDQYDVYPLYDGGVCDQPKA